jgi:hypothetical protein
MNEQSKRKVINPSNIEDLLNSKKKEFISDISDASEFGEFYKDEDLDEVIEVVPPPSSNPPRKPEMKTENIEGGEDEGVQMIEEKTTAHSGKDAIESTPADFARLMGAKEDLFNEKDVSYIVGLERSLDQRTRSSVYDELSIIDPNDEPGDDEFEPREVGFDPRQRYVPDPMDFGTYRRWKVIEQEESRQGKGSRKKGGKTKSGRNGKGKNDKSTTDNFYDALKKFGSGPTAKGTPSTTGVSDAPKGMKPVVPRRPKKKNRKMITPDDINSLFKKSSAGSEEKSANDDDGDDDVEVGEESDSASSMPSMGGSVSMSSSSAAGSTSVSGSSASAGNAVSPESFNPLNDGKEIPKWLVDADKEAKKQRAMRGKKKKKITDDWRFWAACITGVGFVSAFFNIYQQTGGLGTGDKGDELII